MSYYKIINGIAYDRKLLEAAEAFTKGRGESRISLEEIQQLHQMALDAGKLTVIETRTLQYIAQHYVLTEPAKKWFSELNNVGNLEDIIYQIVREEFGLPNLRWQIDPIEVSGQQVGPSRDFPTALRGALEAFLRGNQGQLSFSAVVSRRDLAYNDSPNQEAILKSYLDMGTIFLIPKSPEARANFEFDTPDALDQEYFWVFGLQIPDFFPLNFVAYILRYQLGQHSEGYFSRKPDLETLAFRAIRQYAQYSNLQFEIDFDEVKRQLDSKPDQNFGNAIFYALYDGIYNGESSFSFRDFIGQEIWADPDRDVQDYQRDYIETGTLRLLSQATDPAFPVPDMFWPGISDVWVFGLEMPRKTHARFVITVNREMEYSSFNDGFIIETQPFEERVQKVIAEEFKLEGLKWVVNEEHDAESEYEAQRLQFGPDWRHFPGLLRQALNTVLNDYIRPWSVFNIAKEVLKEEVSPENYDTVEDYRAAIQYRIRDYLKTGSIEFLPIELPDNNPVDGEKVEDNWLFFLRLPALSDHAFFIILPRWPDDGQVPYNYGAN